MTDPADKAQTVADATLSASAKTAAHIEHAAEKNEDPEVAAALQDAAVAADTTVARVSWLRSVLNRVFGRTG